MFNVLLADGTTVEFNKKCYRNNYEELINKHQVAWNKSKESRKVFQCKLTKRIFSKAEDLVNQYEKDVTYKKNENYYLNQAHFYVKDDK